ncbi:transmembrane and ubiquitin-like domain-containing protein 1 [Gastrophryne carolinensis]
MPLIEGVGDEVWILFALVLLLSVLLLAWISTHTSSSQAPPTEEEEPGSPLADADSALTPAASDCAEDGATLQAAEGPAQDCDEGAEPVMRHRGPEAPTGSDEGAEPVLRHRGPGAPTGRPGAPTGSDAAPTGSDGGPETITLRLKFLNDTERLLSVRLSDTIMDIKRLHFPGAESRVRLIFQGQLLRDDAQTVASLQLTNGCVLHCHVSQQALPPRHAPTDPPDVPLNIGSFLVPLLLLILALLWCSRFLSPHVFTAPATACLAAITLLVTVIAWATYRS